MSGSDIESDVERRLAQLEADSDARRRQLSGVIQGLPAEVSRRDVIRDSLGDLRSGSGMSVLRRSAATIRELPRRVTGWVRTSLGR